MEGAFQGRSNRGNEGSGGDATSGGVRCQILIPVADLKACNLVGADSRSVTDPVGVLLRVGG